MCVRVNMHAFVHGFVCACVFLIRVVCLCVSVCLCVWVRVCVFVRASLRELVRSFWRV